MGTVVNYGRGRGVITSTGMHTQLGLIATMLQSVQEEQTPLQKKLDQLGKTLGFAALIVCGLVFAVGLIDSAGSIDLDLIVGLFMIAVSLAVAAVPEGLPAVVTVSLALGMQEMIKRHALIRRLSSVETLGSATVICSDKTGTLTQNEMTVTRVWADETMVRVTGQGYTPVGDFYIGEKKTDLKEFSSIRAALWLGVLNNDAVLEESEKEDGGREFRMVGDPTEGSILVAAYKAGGATLALNKAYPRTNEIPFDSDFKRLVTVHSVTDPRFDDLSPFKEGEREGCSVVAVKGAPDVVLKLCKFYEPITGGEPVLLDEGKRKNILAANDEMTGEALRVLGVAYRLVKVLPSGANREELEQDLVFVGLIGMIDPARPEVTPALETATRAGIRTIMITGDYPNTARAIAESIGLLRPGTQFLSGHDVPAVVLVKGRPRLDRAESVFRRLESGIHALDALRNIPPPELLAGYRRQDGTPDLLARHTWPAGWSTTSPTIRSWAQQSRLAISVPLAMRTATSSCGPPTCRWQSPWKRRATRLRRLSSARTWIWPWRWSPRGWW